MPLGELQASSALPPRIMHHQYRSILDDMVTGTSQSPAKIHVLIVEIKLLIESADLRERFTLHEKKHTCQPIGFKQTRRSVGICAVMPAEGQIVARLVEDLPATQVIIDFQIIME